MSLDCPPSARVSTIVSSGTAAILLQDMRASKGFLIALAAVALIALAIAIPNRVRERGSSATNPCVGQLRVIDDATQQWALQQKKTSDDIPTWDDIRLCFPDRWSNTLPSCPDGGKYKLGRGGGLVEAPPTCSIGGAGHSIYDR